MSQDAEKVKRLIDFKERLETKTKELDSELKDLQAMIEIINSTLLEKSFKRAQIPEISRTTDVLQSKDKMDEAEVEPSTPEQHKVSENVTQLLTDASELLANLYVDENTLHIVPAEDKDFDVKTPPFTHFLVERVLAKMQERDNELARAKKLAPDKILCYNIVRKGDKIQEIVIRNFDSDRLRELKSSIRWTLEKMYEKMKDQS